MKKIGLILLFLLSSQVVQAAQSTGFYIGILGGYVIPQNVSMTETIYGDTDVELKNGGMVGFKSGWLNPFTRNILALEMEYNYIFDTDFDGRKEIMLAGYGPDATLDGTIRIHAVLFNVKARFPEGFVHPYAGFGLGYSYFETGDIIARQYSDGSFIDIIREGSGGAFCYQLVAGVDFDIAPNLSLGVGYKYFAAEPNIEEYNFWGSYDYDLDYRTSIITLGLTFRF